MVSGGGGLGFCVWGGDEGGSVHCPLRAWWGELMVSLVYFFGAPLDKGGLEDVHSSIEEHEYSCCQEETSCFERKAPLDAGDS